MMILNAGIIIVTGPRGFSDKTSLVWSDVG